MCLPFDYVKKNLIYKLFTTDLGVNRLEYSEAETYENEFNLIRVISMKEQTQEIINLDFELLIELLNSTDHVCQNVSSTVKSLMKLAFNYLFKNNYNKVIEIIRDVIGIFNRNGFYDTVYALKIKLIESKIKAKLKKSKKK